MKYYVSYAFQRKPGDMAEFGCCIYTINGMWITASDIVDLANTIKEQDGYSSVVILSFNHVLKEDGALNEWQTFGSDKDDNVMFKGDTE